MINLIQKINYKDLIGHYFYINNRIPYAIIDNVVEYPNKFYRLYLKDISNNKYLKYIDLSYEEIITFYNRFLIRQERNEIIKNRTIKQIVHFTKVSNLESIFENGLLSVNNLQNKLISYSPSDLNRLDGKLNKISTSISYPNYKMFYPKRMQNTNIDWTIITINPILIVHKLDSEFYKTNAANGIYISDYTPTSNNDFKDMFYKEDRASFIPAYYTTDPQAEILIEDKISNNYFLSIETIKPNPKVKSLTRDAHINYNPNSSLFNARSDYKRWQ